jgi:hypothetical protein
MKTFWMYAVALGIISVGLFACQPTADKTVCGPTSSPFATPATNDPNDVSFVYSPNITIGRVCTFRGQVTRAQIYEHKIVEGLIFCLRPDTSWHKNDGWDIAISDTTTADCGQDFNGIVTPPFHGENPISIVGYQFRNKDNTAENDGSVNAPQKVREFNFLFNKEDFETVWSAHNCFIWKECKNGMTIGQAVKTVVAIPKSRGVMTITNLELGNLIPNDRAWIESMEFEVKIYLPAEQ